SRLRKPLLCLRKTWGYLRVGSVFQRKTALTPVSQKRPIDPEAAFSPNADTTEFHNQDVTRMKKSTLAIAAFLTVLFASWHNRTALFEIYDQANATSQQLQAAHAAKPD
ncbi:hypothetical protein, partial [Stenotrophomonas sp.]|uniref:hypothetical protein n=1 Tax=Stenotrophomonas sp. TaxID=69392 RepID=UPI0028A9FC38